MEHIQHGQRVYAGLTGLPAGEGNTTLYLFSTFLKNRRYLSNVGKYLLIPEVKK